MEVKLGYKRTEAGMIPEGWNLALFSELFSLRNGVNADKYAYGKGIPFINVLEVITKGHLKASDIVGRVMLTPSVVETYAVRHGDVVFNRTSETQEEVGLAAVYLDNKPVVFGGFVIRARPTTAKIDARFSGYALRVPSIRSQIIARGQGAIRANVGQGDLKQVMAAIPPFREQTAIAEALSDADALIESLEQLHAKKRQIKQGAMQELLTGWKRLPAFSKEWEVRRLGELASIRSGGTPSTTQPHFWGGDILWCTPTDITGLNGFKYLSDTSRKLTQAGLLASSAEIIPAESVVMTSRATIGECAINRVPVSTNQGFKSFVPFETVDVEFLYYLLVMQRQAFLSLCGGSTFLEISKTQLAGFEVRVPKTKAEQSAIATILADMDAEIDALEAKRAKARRLKQGMMQELLTGRIRLPIDGGARAS